MDRASTWGNGISCGQIILQRRRSCSSNYDSDAVPILTMRCQFLFDDMDRVLLRSWAGQGGRGIMDYVEVSRDLFLRAAAEAQLLPKGVAATVRQRFSPDIQFADFMASFPVVVPRPVFPTVRRLIRAVHGGTSFDDAFIRMGVPSHADLIAKTALLLHPHLVRHIPCPPLHKATPEVLDYVNQMLGGDGSGDRFDCLRLVEPVEHVRHPLSGCHSDCRHFKPYFQARDYADKLLNETKDFGPSHPIPHQLFHYHANRSVAEVAATRRFVFRHDHGRVCGVPRSRS